MDPLRLSARQVDLLTTSLPEASQYAVIGANGAGKSRFVERLHQEWCGEKLLLSPVLERFPSEGISGLQCRLDIIASRGNEELFRQAQKLWSDIFAGSHLSRSRNGHLRFRNSSGNDTITVSKLSRGEKSCAYFLAGVLTAPAGCAIFADSPTLFMHPTVSNLFWNSLISLRPDCKFIFDTSDVVFTSRRSDCIIIWVRSYTSDPEAWEYEIVDNEQNTDEFMLEMLGNRRATLFIEGDTTHSIDYRLYSAIFPEFHVRAVGSCNKVIEATRTFSSLNRYHFLESHGLVDRDRRTAQEVRYLRQKGIMVPEVAEIENIFLTREVLEIMARVCHRSPGTICRKVRGEILSSFGRHLEEQALQHTRHRMKREVERKIDARFSCITALELHVKGLIHQLRPREHYDYLLKTFRRLLSNGDTRAILQVFNHKPLLTGSCAIRLLGFKTAEEYIEKTLHVLQSDTVESKILREAIRNIFLNPEPLEVVAFEETALIAKSRSHKTVGPENSSRAYHVNKEYNHKPKFRHKKH